MGLTSRPSPSVGMQGRARRWAGGGRGGAGGELLLVPLHLRARDPARDFGGRVGSGFLLRLLSDHRGKLLCASLCWGVERNGVE